MALGVLRHKIVFAFCACVIICGCLAMYYLDAYNVIFPDHKHLFLTATFFIGAIMQSVEIGRKQLKYLWVVTGLLVFAKVTRLIPTDIFFDEIVFFSLSTYFIAFTSRFSYRIRNDVSYGVYIYAFPLQQYFFQRSGFNPSTLLNLSVSLICVFVLAYLSWVYIERPALRFKHIRG